MLLSFSVETPAEFGEVFEKLEDIFLRLHRCRHLDELLQCGVQQTRQIFGCDRALVYQFIDNGDGAVTAESVGEDWSPILGQLIYDPCFEMRWGDKFQRGEITAIADIVQADLEPCYLGLMERLQVKANLVSPILVHPVTSSEPADRPILWGLLIVHQCGEPRTWQTLHQQVIQQISTQIGLAIRHLQQTQALARSRQDERQLQVAIETAECGVWQWRLDTDEVIFSRAWKTLLGYRDQDIGANFDAKLALLHDDDRERVQQTLRRHFDQQTAFYRSEHRLRCRDGSWKWVCSRGRVTARQADGTPLHFIGLIVDISDRKQHEQALQHQAQRQQALNEVIEAIRSSLDLQTIFEVAATQIAQCLNGRVRISEYVAAAACWRTVAIDAGPYGWTAEQRVQVWADIPDDNNPFAAQLKQLQIVQFEDTSNISAADTINHPIAQHFPGQWLLVPIAIDAEVWGAISLTRPTVADWDTAEIELTQRIATQLAIAIHHANLHHQAQTAFERDALVLQSINEGIWDWRATSGLEQVSERYWEILGHPPPDSPVRLETELERVHPDDREAMIAAVQNHFQTREPFQHELRVQHREGHYIWVRLRGRAIWDAAGQPIRMLGSVEDISDRKALEIRLRQQGKDFRTLVENNPDGILRISRRFQILYANPIMRSRIGVAQTELVGKTLREIGMSRRLTNRWQSVISRVFETGQEQLLETQELLAVGEHTFYSRIVPEFNNNEQIVSVLVISRNVTNLRKTQIALQRQVEQEHTLRLITQHIRATLNLNEILSTAVNEVQRSLHADRTIIIQLFEDHSRVVIAEAVRADYPAMLHTRREREETSLQCLSAYRTGQGYIVPDIAQDDCDPDLVDFLRQAGVKAKMVAPIIQPLDQEQVVWGLLITHACERYRDWRAEELNLLQKVAEQLAIAIQQSELHQRLQAANEELARISTTDALTQIANRRHFDTTLEQEWQRTQREQRELALVFCDIDWFKRYNDTYGHPAGDACIAAVAKALQQCINRSTDCLARYGGEEFALILPHTNAAGAIVIVEQIRRAIAALNIYHPAPQANGRLTLSFGIATTIPQADRSPQDLMDLADRALYQAKQTGRDRYTVVNGERTQE